MIPEFNLLKGDLLTVAGAADADAAHWFHRAFDRAASAGVRMTQLRAAARLCRLWRSQGRNDADRCYAVCTTPVPRASRPRTYRSQGPSRESAV